MHGLSLKAFSLQPIYLRCHGEHLKLPAAGCGGSDPASDEKKLKFPAANPIMIAKATESMV
jgi:hypothetical protein